MKKLMVMLSAAALAFGLHAADDGFKAGSGFEDDQPGAFTPSGDWSQGGTTAGTFEVKAYGEEAKYQGEVPAQYTGVGDQYLKVATTFGNPLLLTNSDPSLAEGDLYFDSLVKFTACDYEDDPTSTGAKLLVYLKENEDGTETKLYVKAGKIVEGQVSAETYDCGKWEKGDAWVRLTVRAIGDVTDGSKVPGFVVFVDGEAAVTSTAVGDDAFVKSLTKEAAAWDDYNSAHALFPSLIQDGTAAKLEAVGFDGQGSIDDVAITSTQPAFAKDSDFFTITFDSEQVDLTVAGKTITESPYAYPFKSSASETKTVSVVATAKEGFAITDMDAVDCSYDAVQNEVTIFAGATAPTLDIASKLNKPVMTMTIDGEPVTTPICSFADAVDIINNTQGSKFAVTLTDNVSVGDDGEGLTEAFINSSGAVVIDLAGKTITGAGEGVEDYVIYAQSQLTIVDSVGDGKICISDELTTDSYLGVVGVKDTALVIGAAEGDEGATFDGDVVVEGTGTSSIVKGFFAQDSMEGLTIADGSACSAEKVDDYWVVAPIVKHGWAIYLAQDTDGAFLIQDAGDLLDLATNLNKTADFATEGITFKQTDDIDLAGIAWEGIGAYVGENKPENNMFCGVYDGNECAVKNITFAKKEYNGLFGNLGGEAQIKDLTITVAGFADGDATNYGFGAAAGYAMGTDVLLENITVNPAVVGQDSICGTHNMGGIGARLAGKITLKDCTNNLAISTTYSKIGGMCAIASQRDAVGAIEFNGCVNNGEITGVGLSKANTEAGSDGCAGILGYIQDGSTTTPKAGSKPVSFINCANYGTLQHTGETGITNACIASILGKAGGQVYQTVDGNSAKEDYLSVASGTAPNGLKFATVEGGVATFVKDATLAKDGQSTYKVMAANAPVELAMGQSIVLDETVATAKVTTQVSGYRVKSEGTDVVTYSLEPIPVTSIALDIISTNVAPEEVFTLTATVLPADALDKTVTWEVDPAGVVTLSAETGDSITVTAVAAGTATITAKAGAQTATCAVTVKAAAEPDPTTDKPDDIPANQTAADRYGNKVPEVLGGVSAKSIATWAQNNGQLTKGDEIMVEAFLLDCANTDAAVAEAKKAFVFTSIAQDADGNWVVKMVDDTKLDDSPWKNGKIQVKRYSDVTCLTEADNGNFFKATLEPINVSVDE